MQCSLGSVERQAFILRIRVLVVGIRRSLMRAVMRCGRQARASAVPLRVEPKALTGSGPRGPNSQGHQLIRATFCGPNASRLSCQSLAEAGSPPTTLFLIGGVTGQLQPAARALGHADVSANLPKSLTLTRIVAENCAPSFACQRERFPCRKTPRCGLFRMEGNSEVHRHAH
jgi:hypothetical protein